MKVLSFSRISIVIALALGITTLWVAAAPSTTGADSLIGGWTLVRCQSPCGGTHTESCQNGPAGTQGSCHPTNNTLVCSSGIGGVCKIKSYDRCDSGGYACPGSESYCD